MIELDVVLRDVVPTINNHKQGTRKDFTKIFKDIGLKITAEANLKVVSFLDITLNLSTGLYQPCRKPNDQPRYVNVKSNHPPTILKNLPSAIGKRLSSISSNPTVFADVAPLISKRSYRAAITKRYSTLVTKEPESV